MPPLPAYARIFGTVAHRQSKVVSISKGIRLCPEYETTPSLSRPNHCKLGYYFHCSFIRAIFTVCRNHFPHFLHKGHWPHLNVSVMRVAVTADFAGTVHGEGIHPTGEAQSHWFGTQIFTKAAEMHRVRLHFPFSRLPHTLALADHIRTLLATRNILLLKDTRCHLLTAGFLYHSLTSTRRHPHVGL